MDNDCLGAHRGPERNGPKYAPLSSATPSSGEQRTVGVQPPKMGVEHIRFRWNVTIADQVGQRDHRLSLVHGVDDHALEEPVSRIASIVEATGIP